MEISQFFKQSNTKGKHTHIIIFIILTIFLTIAAFISGKIRDGRTPINAARDGIIVTCLRFSFTATSIAVF